MTTLEEKALDDMLESLSCPADAEAGSSGGEMRSEETQGPPPIPERTNSQPSARFASMQRDTLKYVLEMNEDEIRVVHRLCKKIMGEGRRENGPLLIRHYPKDAAMECADETADALFYALLRAEQMGGGDK